MTRDEIISMAREADEWAAQHLSVGEFHPDFHEVRDERFAALVAAAEREECAKVCWHNASLYGQDNSEGWESSMECAAAIRSMPPFFARGKK